MIIFLKKHCRIRITALTAALIKPYIPHLTYAKVFPHDTDRMRGNDVERLPI